VARADLVLPEHFISAFARHSRSACAFLLHDGWPKPFFRLQFAYVDGNHERIYGGGDAVEMYVSF